MNFLIKLQSLDRRWIYLLVALAIIIPLLIPFDSKTYTTEPVENIYQKVDSFSGKSNKAILMVFMHDASTMPELFPMEVSVLRHCFERNVKVFTICFTPTAAPLVDYAINTVREQFPDKKSGVDYCNFGYKPAALMLPMVLGMGEDISKAVDIDSEGRKIANLPIMKDIKNYNEMNLIVNFSGSDYGYTWITYARSKFGANVAAGVTAVMAADAYPFLQTGQLLGMMAGLKGASEYEKLDDVFASYKDATYPSGRPFSKEIITETIADNTFKISDQKVYAFKKARIGMNSQSAAHILIIIFIIIGNLGYFIEKSKQKQNQ